MMLAVIIIGDAGLLTLGLFLVWLMWSEPER